MTVVGILADGRPTPMVTGIAACAAIALVLTVVTLKRSRAVEAAVAAE
jgi:hypothetical protein